VAWPMNSHPDPEERPVVHACRPAEAHRRIGPAAAPAGSSWLSRRRLGAAP
jgi:hypothetical protein